MRKLIFIVLILLFSGMSMAANAAPPTDAPLTGIISNAQTVLPDMRYADKAHTVTFTTEYRFDKKILRIPLCQASGEVNTDTGQQSVFTVPSAAGELQSADRAWIRKIPKPPLAVGQSIRHY